MRSFFSGETRILRETLRIRLIKEFEGQIGFCSLHGGGTIMYFADTEYKALKNNVTSRGRNIEDEETKILDQAAAIIRRHISIFPFNRDEYPPSDSLLDGLDDNVPDKLKYLISKIVLTKRSSSLRKKMRCHKPFNNGDSPAKVLYITHAAWLGSDAFSQNLLDVLIQLGYTRR